MTNLSIVAAVIDVARARPARPLREFFQRPQMPIREMYLYRFLVNLTWYARNYMNIVLIYIFLSALVYPLFLLNLAAAGLLHFVVGWRASGAKNVKNEEDRKGSSSPTAVEGHTSAYVMKAVGRSIVNGLHETADTFLQAASGRDLETPITPSSQASSGSSKGEGVFGSSPKFPSANSTGDEPDVIKRIIPPKALQATSSTAVATKDSSPPRQAHPHHKKHTMRSAVFKLVQLGCCCVVFWSYGVGVCFVATLIPVFIICLHAVLTPYGDEASEFFENAARSRGTEIDAPSTPVQAFQGKQETSFSAARERLERQAPNKVPTMNLPSVAEFNPSAADEGVERDSPTKLTFHAHSASDLLHHKPHAHIDGHHLSRPPSSRHGGPNVSPRTKLLGLPATSPTSATPSHRPLLQHASSSGGMFPHTPSSTVAPFSMEPRSFS